MSGQGPVERGRLLGQFLRKWLSRGAAPVDFVAQADRLRLQGKLEEAEAVCAQGLASFPTYASAHVLMGDIFRDRGLTAAAEAEWNEACRLHPEHPRANLRLAQLYLARGEIAPAMAALELSLLYSPDSQEGNSLLAQATEAKPRRLGPDGHAAWLTPSRFDELLSAIGGCPSVTATALIAPDGEVAGSGLRGSEQSGLAVMLMLESRHLLRRIEAGPLRAALIRGKRRDLQCFEVDGFVLLAYLHLGTPVGLVRTEIQRTVAALRRRWDDGGTKDALASAA